MNEFQDANSKEIEDLQKQIKQMQSSISEHARMQQQMEQENARLQSEIELGRTQDKNRSTPVLDKILSKDKSFVSLHKNVTAASQ